MAVPDEEDLSPAKSDENESHHGYCLWHGIRIQIAHSDTSTVTAVSDANDVAIDKFETLFSELGVEIESDEINEWLTSDANDGGVHIYTDTEICELVSRSEDSHTTESESGETSDEEELPVISNGDAAHFFGLCLTWLESQPEARVYNTSVLRELRSLAARKRIESLKQTKISRYVQ